MKKSGEISEKEGRKKKPKSTLTRKNKFKKPSTLDLEILQGTVEILPDTLCANPSSL